MKLNGKVAFITGGGGGIGSGIAEAFAERGMKLVLADIDLDRASEQTDRVGDGAIAVALDVTSLDSRARGGVRSVWHDRRMCNNAGISQPYTPMDQVPP